MRTMILYAAMQFNVIVLFLLFWGTILPIRFRLSVGHNRVDTPCWQYGVYPTTMPMFSLLYNKLVVLPFIPCRCR